jgi:hypothetical protein
MEMDAWPKAATFGESGYLSRRGMNKEEIIAEIRRTAEENGGVPLGKVTFAAATEIGTLGGTVSTGAAGARRSKARALRRIARRSRTEERRSSWP